MANGSISYVGWTLKKLREDKSTGLLKDLLIAELDSYAKTQEKLFGAIPMSAAEEIKVTEELMIKYAGIRDAFINFLTHPDLHFTISEMKASLELEEFKTTGALHAKVDTQVDTQVNTTLTVAPGIPIIAGPVPGTSVGPGTGTGIGKGQGKGAGYVTEALKISKGGGKTGGKHGGRLIATGHAYIGESDPTPNSDTMEEENDFTKVRLIYDKIPQKIL